MVDDIITDHDFRWLNKSGHDKTINNLEDLEDLLCDICGKQYWKHLGNINARNAN